MSTQVDALALAMCKAYARNSGNVFEEHFNPHAATSWMRQALEEAGVVELIEAGQDVIRSSSQSLEEIVAMARLIRALEGAGSE